MMKIIKNKIIFPLIIIGLMAPLKIFAALQINWPSSPAGTPLNDASTLTELTKYFYEWAITLGILAFFVSVVINGVRYMTSTGNPGKMEKSRKRIQSSAAGLALLLGSWIILNFLNPRLTTLFIPDPDQPLANQLADYDMATLTQGDCSLVILYPEKYYNPGTFDVENDLYFDATQDNPEFIGRGNPGSAKFTPRSVRILKKLSNDEIKALQDQVDKENIIKKAEGKPEKALKQAIKETYGSLPYTFKTNTYVDSPAGCAVYFYSENKKGLLGILGTEYVVAFQFYSSTPDFGILYSEDELQKIKKQRVVFGGK